MILVGLVHPGGLLSYLRDYGVSADQLREGARAGAGEEKARVSAAFGVAVDAGLWRRRLTNVCFGPVFRVDLHAGTRETFVKATKGYKGSSATKSSP
jgi:hypothetical protein